MKATCQNHAPQHDNMASGGDWRRVCQTCARGPTEHCFSICYRYDGAKLFRVQFHQDSPDTADESRDGRWRHGSALSVEDFGNPLGLLRKERRKRTAE